MKPFAGVLSGTLIWTLSLTLTFFAFAAGAIAAPLEIKIKSWQRTDQQSANDRSAEVCGNVIGSLTGNEKILLTVDTGRYETEYMTLLSPKGNFCHIVSTYLGRIRADVVTNKNEIVSSTELIRH